MQITLPIIAVLIVAAFNIVLAGLVLAQNTKSRVNQAFALLATMASLWGFGTGLFLVLPSSALGTLDLLARANYFFGGSIATAFLYFAWVFYAPSLPTRRTAALIFLPALIFFVLYFFSHTIVAGVELYPGGVRGFRYGGWDFLFELHTWGYFGAAFVILLRRYRAVGGIARRHILSIMVGTYLTLAVAGVTNILLPHVGNIFEYIWVGPAAILWWLGAVAYSVARLQLFRVRTLASELVVALLWLVLLARLLLSPDERTFLINLAFFVVVLVVGILLIRSAIAETEQREVIEAQGREIARVNLQQEALLHFIGHEIKSYFAKIEAAFSCIVEGDYGPTPIALTAVATNALADVRMGTDMVMNILDASNIKKGALGYKKEIFDFVEAVRAQVALARAAIAEKGLSVTLELPPSSVPFLGDKQKLEQHVIRNLIDNAMRYTPAGAITVTLTVTEDRIELMVEDAGVGISPEDASRLFTEGGHGKDSLKVNVHSTGYGLYIAKQVVEAHGGTITAHSDGVGKGARFEVVLPNTKS